MTKQHISFSELKTWAECPFKHKVIYIDKQKGFTGNEFTAFGSSIHSAKTKNWIAFSTAVEPLSSNTHSFKDMFDTKPGPGILGNDSYVYLWRKKNDIEVVFNLKKDWMPPTLFQFGTVIFPEYCVPDSDFLYCYCVGLKGFDGCTVIKDIS